MCASDARDRRPLGERKKPPASEACSAKAPAARAIDYSGTGFWSRDEVQRRYRAYCAELGITAPRTLAPQEHRDADTVWRYPVMDAVIAGIEAGDEACIRIGIEFIEESASFPFGRILKSNTARALRRANLSAEHKERIRARVVDMLISGYLPREFVQYAKLAKRIGLGDHAARLRRELDPANPWVVRYCRYLTEDR